MMKLVIFAVLGLLVGIGGGSAVSVMNAKKAYAAHVAEKAALVADSLAKAEEEGTTHAAADEHEGAPEATVDSTAAETHVAAAESHGPAPEAHPPTPPTVKTAPPKGYSRAVQTVESNGAPGTVPRTASKPTPPAKPIPTAPAASPAPGAAKVAKIFAAMPPKDAAMVLEQLDDAEVQSVISSLSEKQAAAIMRNFPPQRAALISKAVLRSALAKP